MSSSDGQVTLVVRTEDAAAEIFVVDGTWRLVGRGLGSLSASLPAGLYKVKVQTGSQVQEELASLEPDRAAMLGEGSGVTMERQGNVAVMRFPRARFATAVPLANTSRTHEYQLAAAARHSRQVHVARGHGSQVFVFARTWTHPYGLRAGPSSAGDAEGAGESSSLVRLELRDLAGRLLVDLGRDGAADLEAGDPWVACNVELDPGLYRLRVCTKPYGNHERVVVASPGWQAQVFLYQRWDRVKGRPPRLSLGSASVFLRRLGVGFDPGSPKLRLTELARAGLRSRRQVLPPELLGQMVEGALDDPMLGIYGAHLLLLSDEVDLGLLERVVTALRSLLGRHPDVDALALALRQRPDSPFLVPPMLLRSWPLIVRETISRPDLVPSGSLAARIADRLWGEAPWLLWRAWDSPEEEAASMVAGSSKAVPELPELLRQLRAADPARLHPFAELEGLERLLVASLTSAERPARALPARAVLGSKSTPPLERWVREFGVPMASLQDAAARLLGRLQAAD